MITKQELKEVLQKHEFTEEQIDRILSKLIKTLLENGKKVNIDEILTFLLKEEINIPREKIEKCLSVLARGKAENIKKIFEILDNKEISKEKIEECLSVLALGKAKEIEDILEYLMVERKIPKEKIEKCLYVLAQGKAENIKKIFKILDNNKIEKEQIENNLGYLLSSGVEEVNNIFKEGNILLKKYLQLKGIYDRIVKEEEINSICAKKRITQTEFLKNIRGEDFLQLYQETLKIKKWIYIGKSIAINEEFLNQNAEMLLELSRIVARNFKYQYNMKDLSELESQALDIMITKCGDIVLNYEWNPEILKRIMFRKTFNYLKINLKIYKEILQDFSTDRKKHLSYNVETKSENLNLSQWDISKKQEKLLRYISTYLEEGYELGEAIEHIANTLNVDKEEILEEIAIIREQNSENKIRMGEEK